MVIITPNKKPYKRDIIERFEKLTGLKRLKEYLDFLEKYNGGVPEPNIVELNDVDIQSFSISSFFGVGVSENNDILKQFDLLSKRIPEGCLPIARAEGGNIVCINLSLEKNGYIFLWNHETELLYEDDIKMENLHLIAKSFMEFLDMIKPYDEDVEDLSGYKVQEVWIDPDFLKELENS